MVHAIQSWKSSLVTAMLLTLLSLVSPSVVALANYTQVGSDINGTAAKGLFGTVVSMSDDGNAFVVGIPYAYSRKGAVRVFQKDPNVGEMVNYIQVGEDIVGKADDDYFGHSVSMSGDGTSFVASAPYSNGNKGSVSVYKQNTTDGSYTQVGLDIVGNATNDYFGYSVSMSGDGTSFVAGAPDSNGKTGYASVYKHTTTNGSYIQVGLDIVGKATSDRFGWSVSMSGDGTSFVAGALGSNGYTGYASVYKQNTTNGNFTQVGLDSVGKATNDRLGYSVSMSDDGTWFVAGAPDSSNGKGFVSVYKQNTTNGSFTQFGLDIVGKAGNDFFGTSVSMSGYGTSFVVGAPGSNVLDGSVRVYKYSTPTQAPTSAPTSAPTFAPTSAPTTAPIQVPTSAPTFAPTSPPTTAPTQAPTSAPTLAPTFAPTYAPTTAPTQVPTSAPTFAPTSPPTTAPTQVPTSAPTAAPTSAPTTAPTQLPASAPTSAPTAVTTKAPTASPTTKAPRAATTKAPSKAPVFVIPPTETPIATNENCGLFGWNLFCPRRGECGFVKRLLNLGGCS